MVEMSEAANILHNATPHSLVLLDEIGRGTSTYDGLALAWACASYLARELRAFTLFATHYFELTALADELPGVANVHLAATEHRQQIVFLHAVREGPASQSYGIQVARLAGVPNAVLGTARRKLEELEARAAAAGATAADRSLCGARSRIHCVNASPRWTRTRSHRAMPRRCCSISSRRRVTCDTCTASD